MAFLVPTYACESQMTVTIFHNPRCNTSRTVLAALQAKGLDIRIVEYLKQPPDRAALVDLLRQLGIGPRGLMRRKEAAYGELGLDDPALSDDRLIDAILAHPILIERPIVVTPKGARICRPVETLAEIL
jgi:arsenate reductase